MRRDRVLVVEDEEDSAQVLEAYLKREGFETRHVTDGLEALEVHTHWQPDLVLLDVMLPSLDGYQVLSAIRQHAQTPVIMVTAVGDETRRINSLLFGADDYVIKPYNPGEVVARVLAVLRRWRQQALTVRELRHENLVLDVNAGVVQVQGDDDVRVLDLTRSEFSLLSMLMAAPTRLFSRAELMAGCMPGSNAMERVIDAHVYNLRRKLEQAGVSGVLVTVRGLGYRFRRAA